ncbi:MAG TPA: orotidine-5'-phosphate decarboxylase, partial [Aestuariivirga sp.]|nr:orotidine-5'-phosphate decarboxylase [Aestuariivirga sp.]
MTAARNPICVALDTSDLNRALTLARSLKPHAGLMKVGMEFFYAHGAKGYERVAAEGLPIFLDLKLHDIPNTVASALAALMRLSPQPAIVNVHALGGRDMMRAARDSVQGHCKLIAVTILTSLSDADMRTMGFDPAQSTEGQARLLAQLVHQAGLDGIVCSPADLRGIRESLGREFLTVVPGIRPEGSATQDQKRIATPAAALAAGADILVIGRAITEAADPAQSTEGQARLLAQLVHQAGLDGIVCSPADLRGIRESLGREFLT